MNIEIASPDDTSVVLALVESLLAELGEEGEEFQAVDRTKLARELESSRPRFTALLARTPAGEAVGVMTVTESFALYAGGNYGVIDEMYVQPGYRCRGVGRLLLDAATELAKARGWFRLDVAAPVGERWTRTISFYQTAGFEYTGPKLRLIVG